MAKQRFRRFQPQRLLKLVELLRKDAKNKNGIRFDYCEWGFVNDPDNPLSCGTTACAMGLAALSGAFKRQGLSAGIEEYGAIFPIWKKKKKQNWFYTASHLFGISFEEAVNLFAPDDNNNDDTTGAEVELAVAKKNRSLRKGKGCPIKSAASAHQPMVGVRVHFDKH